MNFSNQTNNLRSVDDSIASESLVTNFSHANTTVMFIDQDVRADVDVIVPEFSKKRTQ